MPAQILVVDDELEFNATVRDIFEPEIERGDYQIEFASTGREALEKLLSNPSASTDLILTDVRMPDLDGLAFVEQLKQKNLPVKIILISAYVSPQDVEDFIANNSNILEFYTKAHVDINRLRETVNQLLPSTAQEGLAPSFDYSSLDRQTSQYIQQQTEEIRSLMKRTAQSIIEIGQKLISVKEKLGHGNFLDWLKAEFNWSIAAANRFMQVAQQFEFVNLTNLDIAPSALYLLAAPSLPEEAREEALLQAKLGKPVSYTVAKEIKQKYTQPTAGTKLKEEEIERKEDRMSVSLPSSLTAPPTQKIRHRVKGPSALQPESPQSQTDKNKPEILAIRPKQEGTRDWGLETREESPSSPQPLAPRPSKLVQPGTWWQLGEQHLLYCGNPNSPRFQERLPERVALMLAFPPHREDWPESVSSREQSAFSLFTVHQERDLELLKDAVAYLLDRHTDEQDVVVFSFLPDSELLVLADEFGCRCFVAEPDASRCDAAIASWKRTGAVVQKIESLRF